MKKSTSFIPLLVIVLLASLFTSCGYEITKKVVVESDKEGAKTTCDSDKYNLDYDKYDNAVAFRADVQIKSSNVLEKANDIRNKILSITSAEIESFYANKDRAEIRIFIPEKKAASVQKMLSSYPDIVQINERSSNIGSNYVDYSKKYTFYKLLNDNFDVVEKLVSKETCDKADILDMKKLIQNNVQNYENNIKNYKKQINNAYYQINISKN